mmetsp:Transcript_34194/g.103240  ORF Transcript_34194/g.103240 Transcript_34194/m.103240 type:complete len:239 (+) Transcript_34194:378-1094(+)
MIAQVPLGQCGPNNAPSTFPMTNCPWAFTPPRVYSWCFAGLGAELGGAFGQKVPLTRYAPGAVMLTHVLSSEQPSSRTSSSPGGRVPSSPASPPLVSTEHALVCLLKAATPQSCCFRHSSRHDDLLWAELTFRHRRTTGRRAALAGHGTQHTLSLITTVSGTAASACPTSYAPPPMATLHWATSSRRPTSAGMSKAGSPLTPPEAGSMTKASLPRNRTSPVCRDHVKGCAVEFPASSE